MQVYNLKPDEKTHKSNATFQYTVKKGKEQVMQFKETSEEMKQTGEQVTIERLLPLVTLAPGKYSLEVIATDTLSNKTVSKSADFIVKAPLETKSAANAAPGREYQVKQERLRNWGAIILALTCFSFGASPSDAQSRAATGKLSGVVRDSTGTPQMGATVEIVPEVAVQAASIGLLTNTQGIFHGERLAPGLYTVRVTLAGFLPTVQQHVRISAHLPTVVRVELESMFASLDHLRRQPSTASVESDDWKWVLRSASVTRPVLQWTENGSTTVTNASYEGEVARPRARLDFTAGARRPGSASNLPSAPSTPFAYAQKLGGPTRRLLAGQGESQNESAAARLHPV